MSLTHPVLNLSCYVCTCLQAYVRGLLARKETRHLRQQRAATNIQTAWRRYKMRQQYNLVLHNITAVQVCVFGLQHAAWAAAAQQFAHAQRKFERSTVSLGCSATTPD